MGMFVIQFAYSRGKRIYCKKSENKQKYPDFAIQITQIGPHSESEIRYFHLRYCDRRICTSSLNWMDAARSNAGMPHNRIYRSTENVKRQD